MCAITIWLVSCDAAAIKGSWPRRRLAISATVTLPCVTPGICSHEYRSGWGLLPRALFSLIHALYAFVGSERGRIGSITSSPIPRTVQRRIRRFYGREATVIHPPCEVDRFELCKSPDDYYLFVGRLVGYKRADLAVDGLQSKP